MILINDSFFPFIFYFLYFGYQIHGFLESYAAAADADDGVM